MNEIVVSNNESVCRVEVRGISILGGYKGSSPHKASHEFDVVNSEVDLIYIMWIKKYTNYLGQI